MDNGASSVGNHQHSSLDNRRFFSNISGYACEGERKYLLIKFIENQMKGEINVNNSFLYPLQLTKNQRKLSKY